MEGMSKWIRNRALLFSVAVGGSGAVVWGADADVRPNIILFVVDDMGWQDTSVPFWKQRTRLNDIYETPNMERLAAQGMLFTQAYASSVSSPTRCSLLTGSNAARHRVTNWTLRKNEPTDLKSETLTFPDWNYNGLAPAEGVNNTFVCRSFVELLTKQGYRTIHCGKAHFGAIDTPGADPRQLGFEVNIAGHAAGGLASYRGEQNYGHSQDGTPVSVMAVPGLERYWGTDTFVTEALTLEAIHALQKAAEEDTRPFFLYMAHYAVHIPFDPDKRFYDKYLGKGLTPKEAAYASLIEGMDKSLGDLMNWLEQTNRADNTIILFVSDNGGLSSDAHWLEAPLHRQNAPLNSGKGSAYEGGIRVPMLVKWPGRVRSGSVCHSYLMVEDFYPTILEMASVRDYETPQKVDGISFVPLLLETGNPAKNRSLFWNFPNLWGNEGPGIGPTCTIRKDDWKLIYYYETGKKELFDIAADLGEENNLAEEHPLLVESLSRELGNYLRQIGGQRPYSISSGKPCPWPDEL